MLWSESARAVLTDVTTPGDLITPTSTNSPGAEQAPNAIDNNLQTKYLNFDKLNTGFTVFPSTGASVLRGLSFTSANDAPERDPASYLLSGSPDGSVFTTIASGSIPAFSARFQERRVTFANSASYSVYSLIFPTVANAGAANSMQIAEVGFLQDVPEVNSHGIADILRFGDPIIPTSTNSPGGELSPNAIDDNTATKYLNFDKLNTGFTVTPTIGSTRVVGLGLTSANDAPERDPASYILSGSTDGVNFTEISSSSIFPFTARFQHQEIDFDNGNYYTTYRLIFPDVANAAAANSMQIAEVQFYGTPVPEPSTWTLAVIAMATVAGLRRRRGPSPA
jgi:hypothetical protein